MYVRTSPGCGVRGGGGGGGAGRRSLMASLAVEVGSERALKVVAAEPEAVEVVAGSEAPEPDSPSPVCRPFVRSFLPEEPRDLVSVAARPQPVCPIVRCRRRL